MSIARKMQHCFDWKHDTHTHAQHGEEKCFVFVSGGMPYTQFVSRIPTKTLHPFILLDSLQFEHGAPLSACIAHRSLMNVVWALPTVIVKYHSNDTDRQITILLNGASIKRFNVSLKCGSRRYFHR